MSRKTDKHVVQGDAASDARASSDGRFSTAEMRFFAEGDLQHAQHGETESFDDLADHEAHKRLKSRQRAIVFGAGGFVLCLATGIVLWLKSGPETVPDLPPTPAVTSSTTVAQPAANTPAPEPTATVSTTASAAAAVPAPATEPTTIASTTATSVATSPAAVAAPAVAPAAVASTAPVVTTATSSVVAATPPPAPAPAAAVPTPAAREPAAASPAAVPAAKETAPVAPVAANPPTAPVAVVKEPAPAAAKEPASPAAKETADKQPEVPTLAERCTKAFNAHRTKDVLNLCSQAIEASPSSASIAVMLAKTELDRGRTKEALTWAQKAVAIDADIADAYVFIGMAEQEAGHTAAAKVAYKRYLQLAPKGKYAAEIRSVVSNM